jgi:hypothetical protein
MIFVNLIAAAFIPFRTKTICIYRVLDYFIMLSVIILYSVEWQVIDE